MKVNVSNGVEFKQLRIGDTFRYLNPSSKENVYLKVQDFDDRAGRVNAVLLTNGAVYSLSQTEKVVRVDTQLNVTECACA